MTAVLLEHRDAQEWRARTTLEKFVIPARDLRPATLAEIEALAGEQQARFLRELGVTPAVEEREGNLLMFGGASCQWETLIGNGTTTGGQALTFFNNANAAIGVGNSSTAAAATQTDLQGTTFGTDKFRQAMDATFPTHTDGTASGNASISFKSTFGSGTANIVWAEWGVFNSATAATGRMLNRKVDANGTKASGSVWAFTVTLSLA